MKNETKVQIIALTDKNALHCQYPGQNDPQACYVELDCKTGQLSATYNSEIGNAIPFSVYHGHEQRFGIPCLTADAANALMEKIVPMAQRVVDGYESEWDGNNNVARFTNDAQAALDEIQYICDVIEVDESDVVQACDADDYWTPVTYLRDANGNQVNYANFVTAKINEIGTVTAKTTNDELAEMKRKMDAHADENGILFMFTERYLTELRQACIDNVDED